MYSKQEAGCFLRLDIFKAFDSVSWPFLLEVLPRLGFGPKWRQWVGMLLSLASSRILLNGIPGPRIPHARGLRQEDPLSPMLFILAIDPLHHILRCAVEAGVLQPFRHAQVTVRVFLYADDAGIFTRCFPEDLQAIHTLLRFFGDASGLRINLDKSALFPIACSEDQTAAALQAFPARRVSFPCSYLGLPLSPTRLKAVAFQPLIDKIGTRLAGWKGRHFTRAGRVVLAKSVLAAMVTYHLTALAIPIGILKQINKLIRRFIWQRMDASGLEASSISLVNWSSVCRPKPLGGLGIPDLDRFGRALRLRWLWFAWT